MTKAPGLLDQRLRFYAYRNSGSDGFVRPVYDFTVERWGRVDVTADNQTVPMAPQAHVEYRETTVATVADYVAVPRNGILKHDGVLYWVRGVYEVRQLRCQRVTLEAIDPTAYATFTLREGNSTLDGVHLVDRSYSDGFSRGFQ